MKVGGVIMNLKLCVVKWDITINVGNIINLSFNIFNF